MSIHFKIMLFLEIAVFSNFLASSVSPHKSRPGSNRWPGLRRKKVTVSAARGANPRGIPVAPSNPLGTSIATSRRAARSTPITFSSRSRLSPAPNTASTTSSARAVYGGEGDRGTIPPRARLSGVGTGSRWGQRGGRDRPTLLRQAPRHDVAVAAIVSGTAQNDRAGRPEPDLDGAGDGPAGVLHQCHPRHPQPGCRRVHLRHFVRGSANSCGLGR